MKLHQISSSVLIEESSNFPFNDKYGRQMGAFYGVHQVIVEQASEDAGYWMASHGGVVTAPGTYYQAIIQNLRNGADYQAYTSKMFTSESEARQYGVDYLNKKAKDAAKKGAAR